MSLKVSGLGRHILRIRPGGPELDALKQVGRGEDDRLCRIARTRRAEMTMNEYARDRGHETRTKTRHWPIFSHDLCWPDGWFKYGSNRAVARKESYLPRTACQTEMPNKITHAAHLPTFQARILSSPSFHLYSSASSSSSTSLGAETLPFE
jgi:hypothetical protein